MTGADILALTRDVVVTAGVIGGAVGAIGIQKWRVAKLESEVQGLKERLKIAEVTSFSSFKKHLQDMKDVYEQLIEEMNANFEAAEAKHEDEKEAIIAADREQLLDLADTTGALLQLTDQWEQKSDNVAERLGETYLEMDFPRTFGARHRAWQLLKEWETPDTKDE